MSTHTYPPTAPVTPPQTYAETQGQAPFDWWLFLRRAEAGQTNTFENIDASLRADRWVTCACGNLCSSIPRWEIDEIRLPMIRDGEPKDEELASLGYKFNRYISLENWSAARDILRRIEARSAAIIAGRD